MNSSQSSHQQGQQNLLIIDNEQDLLKVYLQMQQKVALMEQFQDPGMKPQEMISRFIQIQKEIQKLILPYYIGFLFGKASSQQRKETIQQEKNYLTAFMNLCLMFNCEDQVIFPKNAQKTWENISSSAQKGQQPYKPSRDQMVTNMKEKTLIQKRYKVFHQIYKFFQNSQKIKDTQEQRQSIKDFISMKVYESLSSLRMIEEEIPLLKYKESITKDQVAKERHEEELSKPVPKMKVWNIKKPDEITEDLLSQFPKGSVQLQTNAQTMGQKKQLIAQVWQQNANKPTMTLDEVGQLEYDNMVQRAQRQAKQAQENQVDTDSDKEEVDHRQKKQARNWDDWKDMTQKGAGNRNKNIR